MSLSEHDHAVLDFMGKGHSIHRAYRDRESGETVGSVIGTAADLRAKADELDAIEAADLAPIEAPRYRSDAMNAFEDERRVKDWLLAGSADGLGLTPLDVSVLRTIAEYVNSKSGEAWPGNDTLAALAGGVHRNSIGRSLKRLRDAGLIETQAGGKGFRDRHRLIGIGQPTGLPNDPIGQPNEAIGKPTGFDRSTESVRGSERKEIDKRAAAAPNSESPKPEASGTAVAVMEPDTVAEEATEAETEPRHTTELGISYPESRFIEWVNERFDKKPQPKTEGLRQHMLRHDRADFEASLDDGRLGRRLKIMGAPGSEPCTHQYNGRWRSNGGTCPSCGEYFEIPDAEATDDDTEVIEPEILEPESEVSAVVAGLAESMEMP